jgi:hypothetical protein
MSAGASITNFQLICSSWGRCYDHSFLRFLPIFGEKMAFFYKTNVMIIFFAKTISSLRKKNGENILKIITSVPACVNAFSYLQV